MDKGINKQLAIHSYIYKYNQRYYSNDWSNLMAMYYYYSMLAISIIFVIAYAFIFHKHFDVNLTILTVLVPVINLAFVLMGRAEAIGEALIALRFTYIGGCFVLTSAMFLIFNVCGVPLKPWQKAVLLLISSAIYATTLTIGYNDIFYKGIPDLAESYGASYITNKHYGFMHTVFYVMVIIYYLMTIAVIIYSFIKKKQVPRKILFLIVLAVTVAMVGFFGGRLITQTIELLPATYNLGMIIYLIIASRLRLYDASDSVTDSLVQKGDTGFISFDSKMRYLASNDTAKEMFPEFKNAIVDHYIEDEWAKENFTAWINAFKEDNKNDKFLVERNDRSYIVNISHLKVSFFYHGYQVLISDDTTNQMHIKLIQNYNSQLEAEVIKKTRNIIEMQDKLVLGMATMVEGRDNSTGGHIRRTSSVVSILVDEMKKDESLKLSDKFYSSLIKAAPMHDLGKITIDDAILRKPGKFTPKEYEIMKTHAAEGARIVAQILDGTDDVEFMKIAVNVAHFHHERWDGEGYPDGLKGEEIPLEARIMAIADVYDALVSKRVYKEEFSFEKANGIIIGSMGHHFDKKLEQYYLKARERIEEYYKSSGN